ncbi:MAG: dihydroneopterin aldolase [Bacteroidota bacterium]
MTAKIGLEDVRFHAPHGFYEEEHHMGNEFSIDVEVEAAITGAAEHDDLGGTVNYATIYYLLQAEMKKPTQLLEALAYRMGNRILNQFDSVSSVKLRLRKLNPPLGGKVGAAVVEITVGASDAGGFGEGAGADRFTYEDADRTYGDEGGAFGVGGGGFGGGGGGMGGLIKKPKPIPAAPAPPPPAVYDDDAFDDDDDFLEEEEMDGDFLSDEELAAMVADEDDMEDFDEVDLGDDFDFDDMDFDDMDFGDLDLPDFDPDKFK